MTFRLADRCPRLALARDQRVVELVAERRARRRHSSRLLHFEQLLAHRELQLVRAQATGRRKYIDERHRKLDEARRLLEREKARGARLTERRAT